MLTYKQLEDASNCPSMDCGKCNISTPRVGPAVCVEKLAKTALKLADMLKETTEALDGAVKIMRRYNLDTYIEKSHVVVKAQALLKELEVEG